MEEPFFLFHSLKPPVNIAAIEVIRWRDSLIRRGNRLTTVGTKLSVVRSLIICARTASLIKIWLRRSSFRRPNCRKVFPGVDTERSPVFARRTRPPNCYGRARLRANISIVPNFLRVSEAVSLRVSSFHWTTGRWTLRVKVKGGREWTILVPSGIKKAVDHYLLLDAGNRRTMKTGNGSDGFIFQADVNRHNFGENQPLSTRHLWHLVKKWAELAGIGKVTPHDLPRTAITRALDLGHTYRQVQNGSGHKHIQAVQRYDHHRLSLEDNSINSLNYDDDVSSE